MKLKYLGHSALLAETGGTAILIDPFLTGNPVAGAEAGKLTPDYIVLTHGHSDHVGDAVEIATRTGCTVVSTPEICTWLEQQGVKTWMMNIGGPRSFGSFSLRFTPAWHSSSLPDGSYGGMPMGVVIEAAGKRIYHAGDTALFSDMRLIGSGTRLDVAFLPIGGNFTMDPAQALEAVRLLQPRIVVPIHYGTFPPIEQDAGAFARAVTSETDSGCEVLEPGQSLQI